VLSRSRQQRHPNQLGTTPGRDGTCASAGAPHGAIICCLHGGSFPAVSHPRAIALSQPESGQPRHAAYTATHARHGGPAPSHPAPVPADVPTDLCKACPAHGTQSNSEAYECSESRAASRRQQQYGWARAGSSDSGRGAPVNAGGGRGQGLSLFALPLSVTKQVLQPQAQPLQGGSLPHHLSRNYASSTALPPTARLPLRL
jgi:hypothetical protein